MKRSMLVFFSLSLMLLFSAAYSATINVPLNQPTLHAAVAAAADNDIILVAAGTHSLATTLYITKPLTLQGASQATTVFDAATNVGYGIQIDADNVTLSDFTMIPGTPNYPIHATFQHSPNAPHQNLTLKNITISGHYRTAFDIHGYDGLLLQNLTATNGTWGNGISITGCTNATVTGCTTSGNAWGGIAVYCSKSSYLNRASSGVTIDMAANSIGEYVYVEDEFSLVNTNINVGNSTFSINNDYSATGNFTMYTDKTKAEALAFGVTLNAKFVNTKSVVKETATEDMFVATGLSIQEAINACAVGHTVNVEAGIYTENITIDKFVKLVGAGETTVLRKLATAPIVTITGSGSSNAEPLTLKDLRIEPDKCYGIIFPDGASSQYICFDNLKVVGSPVAYTESEAGVWVRSTATVMDWKVINCYFTESDYAFYFQKDTGGGSGSTVKYFTMNGTQLVSNSHKAMYIEKLQNANFNNCQITNNGLVDFWNGKWNAGIDINLKDGVYSHINFKSCLFSGNAKCLSEGAALMLKARDDGATYGANPASLDNVEVEECDFYDNERGIRVGEPGKNNATPTNVKITECNIYNNVNCSTGGSAYGDLAVLSQATVLAVTNWWGTPTEPLTVSGPAVVCPWYLTQLHEALAGPCLSRTAAFTADTTWGVGQLCVQFTNMSGNADSCNWEFGDGEISSEANPMHCYGQAQKYYSVKLTVFGEFGDPDMVEKTDYITVHRAAAANFNASPIVGVPGTDVQFINNCGGNIQKFCWDFGDGEKAGFRHGTKPDEKVHPTHVYAEAGTYSITLATAGLAAGDTVTVPKLIYIDENYQPIKLESGSDTNPDYSWDRAIDHDVLSTNCKVQAINTDAQAVFAFTDDAKKVVNKVRLMTNTALGTTFANHLLKDFAIEVSVDGTNWETAFEGTITERYDWQVFEFDGAMANFVKLVLKSARGESSPWVSISEFQVFGTPAESIALDKRGITNLSITEYALAQNYPNPFNPSTTISFSLPQAGNVTLSVFNVCGQEVVSLVAGNMSAGIHQVKFDARNLNTGTYFYKIEAGSYQAVRRMVLVK